MNIDIRFLFINNLRELYTRKRFLYHLKCAEMLVRDVDGICLQFKVDTVLFFTTSLLEIARAVLVINQIQKKRKKRLLLWHQIWGLGVLI